MEAIESVHQVEEAVICTLLSSESAIWQVAPILLCLLRNLFAEQPG
ncbi:hypothetical protein [Parabacteroides faecis]|uniref:Uncharacterized protein n=1 Tax=Parabacteroides faecis TaxID=1217282 RepID=A0ABR6KIA7_9BACT|nr:hypothetical protein [Parabacteroides faecis]MBB4621109.1 hypothetical protein [Parabacteroides faecis]